MYFSRSFAAAALVGFGAATTHMGEMAMGMSTSVMASEAMASTAMAAAAMSTGMVAAEGTVATHVIQVGGPNGTLEFSPNNIQAAVGDLVQFQFNPKNHSVVQSTFDKPCVPIQNVMPNITSSFFSGFMPTNATAVSAKQVLTYTIRVMDTKPIWIYCSQAKHCQSGMVGAINAATSGNKTVEAFKALAASAAENLSPGQAAGAGGAGSSGGSGGSGGAATSAAGGAGGAPGSEATATSSAGPAQQSVNAAPGLTDAARQSMFGLTLGGLAAFLVL